MRATLLLLLLAACREDNPKAEDDLDQDGVLASADCNDLDPSAGAPATTYLDADGDGVGGASGDTACEAPTGYTFIGGDCNDGDATVAPGLDEACDGVDNNCDDAIDEGLDSATWYLDADGDGFGDDLVSTLACEPVEGHVTEAGDCDDTDADTYPGADVACTDGDRNCDGSPDNADADGDRFFACEECDDTRADVYPDAVELCDGVDQDCDAAIDEDAIDGATWYTDGDGDGFGDPNAPIVACTPGVGEVSDATDCDDARADTNPAADELCDTADNDCDGEIDENAVADGTWYRDADADGHGVTTDTLTACEAPAGYVAYPDDCDDADAAVSPDGVEVCNGLDDDCDGDLDADDDSVADAGTWYTDADADGYGDERLVVVACEAPADGVTTVGDCDDADATAFPGAVESCDGDDDDCDGEEDEDATDAPAWYADFDGDGFGDATDTLADCEAPEGYVADATDCDDDRADVAPGLPELCDTADNDCDGEIDEETVADGTWYRDSDGDGWGDDADTLVQCAAPVGYTAAGGDCDDLDEAIYPRAPELCNGLDDDCDGTIDAADADIADALTVYADGDADSYGDDRVASLACTVEAGFSTEEGDCDDRDASVYPDAPETCDGDDDDCDGVEDEDATDASTFYQDFDGDGHGDALATTLACDAPAGFEASGDDCDDDRADVFPGAVELCDAADNDCDGGVDEGALSDGTWYEDLDGDGWGDDASTLVQCTQPTGYVAVGGDCATSDATIYPRAPEVCDGMDDDCDGAVDADDSDISDALTVYADNDADGYGDTRVDSLACTVEAGYSADAGDCDDRDLSVYPGATEICDGDDDDCDGSEDEDAIDASTWYEDADRDRWGTDSVSTIACTAPSGYVAASGDCDDTLSTVSPSDTESCDGLDNDCNGTVDDAAGTLWYADADGDGQGDPADSVLSCEAPLGSVEDARDCDDADPAVYVGADEVCNGVDDDCDGRIDDDDPGLLDASTWYIDYDRDGFGAGAYVDVSCSSPAGYASNADDCDDTESDVYPDADERCNGVDDDCDSVVDEDDALDASTWYADADGDGFGDAAVIDVECDVPSGFLADDTDCDDTRADVYPGARERYDLADNDCDGEADDQIWVGTGADGALTVATTVSLDTDLLGTRSDPDAVSFAVAALAGSTVTVSGAVSGIAAGDEVVILNLHGSDAAHLAVGTWMTSYVASVSGSDIVLEDAITAVFGQTDNADLSGQAVFVQRVPQYTDVTVAAGGILTTSAWDGATGGVLFFRAAGTVSVASGGLVTVDELGYAGGNTGPSYNWDAYQGESYAGAGDATPNAVYNEAAGYWANNYGGGGAHITGGGGNFAGGATAGTSWTGGSATAPEAGDPYGDADLSTLFPGSGGGGVWHGSGSTHGPGGDGGGILYIGARAVTAVDAASFSSMGGTTYYWSTGSWTYGAGGGAGGTIWLEAETLTLPAGGVDATGGFGEDAHIRPGGDGGYGRVRLDYDVLNGQAQGTAGGDAEADAVAEPDAGYSTLP